MKRLLIVLALLLIASPAFAQDSLPPPEPSAQAPSEDDQDQSGVLRVFFDCPPMQCDTNNLRQDITFINYVNDRKDADVHVLVTTQTTGSRGREYVFEFIGLDAFAEVTQTLTYASSGTDTDDERRSGVARTFSLGLTPFLLQTAAADQFSLNYRAPRTGAAVPVQAEDDPWNSWIFRVGGSIALSGEESRQSQRVRSNVSANRTTDRWKFSFSGSSDNNQSDITLSSGTEINTVTSNYNVTGSVIKSLGPDHWGLLLRTTTGANTQTNQDLSARLASGIEFDFFPYAESTRRSIVLQYSVGVNYFDYDEITLFGKLSETVADERFALILAYRQPWGTSTISGTYSHYLHDPSKSRLETNGRLDVRLFRGFSLNINGSASRVRNQLYLPAGQATDEEVLLRIRQLATGYRYSLTVGFSYQFGSIYNNVVNPRWSPAGAGGFMGVGGGGG